MKMESDIEARSSDFSSVADSVFQTLLTITTILSGVYASVGFGWFSQAMLEPHPGTPITPEMMTQAMIGIFLGLIFILPLVSVLMSWAYSRFGDSVVWRTASWSGLIYCLSQDFVGVAALIAFPLYMSEGGPAGMLLIVAGAIVIIPPFILGAIFGYRIGMRYCNVITRLEVSKRKAVSASIVYVFLMLSIQTFLALFLLFSVGAL
jgi:hypothetical protein